MLRKLLIITTVLLLNAGCVSLHEPSVSHPPASGEKISDMYAVIDAAKYLNTKYKKENILVVFDIDNTLLASNTDIGSDQWYSWQSSTETDINEKWAGNNFDCMLNIQGILYRLGDMRLTHESVAEVKEYLDTIGFQSIILTSRGPQFRNVTFRELRRNNLEFDKSSPEKLSGSQKGYKPYSTSELTTFSGAEIEKYKLVFSDTRPREVLFEDGVFMTTGQHKGAMLRLLLSKHDLLNDIKAVIFVDDNYKEHVLGMMEALGTVGIEHFAYGYTAEQGNVDEFDAPFSENDTKKQVEKEWCALRKNLPSLYKIFKNDNFNYLLKTKEDIVNCLSYSEQVCSKY